MFKKISLPVLVTVMCLMVTVVVGFVWLNQQRIKTKVFQKPATTVTRTDYSDVARKTLDWIDKQRNDEGWYILTQGCDFEKKTCDTAQDNPEGNQDGLIATWARFNYYLQTQDTKDLEIIKSDINKFFDKYPQGVDNALWICKITYEMYSSNLFDQATKNKLEEICFDSKMDKLITTSVEYKKGLEQRLESNQRETLWTTWSGYRLVRGIDSYFGLPGDLISQYLWTKDNSKLELAKQYFESGKKIIEEKDVSNVRAEDECLLGLSAIDLYEHGGKDENILNYVKEKYLTFEAGDVKKYRTAVCGLMAKRLYQVTGNKTFLTGLENNNKVITKILLDGDGSTANKTGTYGFFITSYGGFIPSYKDVAENGLITELLRN